VTARPITVAGISEASLNAAKGRRYNATIAELLPNSLQ